MGRAAPRVLALTLVLATAPELLLVLATVLAGRAQDGAGPFVLDWIEEAAVGDQRVAVPRRLRGHPLHRASARGRRDKIIGAGRRSVRRCRTPGRWADGTGHGQSDGRLQPGELAAALVRLLGLLI